MILDELGVIIRVMFGFEIIFVDTHQKRKKT
jgi:hypothetical protein